MSETQVGSDDKSQSYGDGYPSSMLNKSLLFNADQFIVRFTNLKRLHWRRQFGFQRCNTRLLANDCLAIANYRQIGLKFDLSNWLTRGSKNSPLLARLIKFIRSWNRLNRIRERISAIQMNFIEFNWSFECLSGIWIISNLLFILFEFYLLCLANLLARLSIFWRCRRCQKTTAERHWRISYKDNVSKPTTEDVFRTDHVIPIKRVFSIWLIIMIYINCHRSMGESSVDDLSSVRYRICSTDYSTRYE